MSLPFDKKAILKTAYVQSCSLTSHVLYWANMNENIFSLICKLPTTTFLHRFHIIVRQDSSNCQGATTVFGKTSAKITSLIFSQCVLICHAFVIAITPRAVDKVN